MREQYWAVGAVTIVIGLTSLSAHAQPMPPCAQIRFACEQAGFVQGAVRDGYGLVIDCIRPIMQGVPQRPRAIRPLPPIDPQLVAACQERNPYFGGAWGPTNAYAPPPRDFRPPVGRPPLAGPPSASNRISGPGQPPPSGPTPGADPAPGQPAPGDQPPAQGPAGPVQR
jgi:hypothetical protein